MTDRDTDLTHGEMVGRGYRGAAATGYDKRRFSTPQGQLIDRLEMAELDYAMRAVNAATRGARVLEVGSGSGRFGLRLVARGMTVVATDVSADMIGTARGKSRGNAPIEFGVADGAALPFPAAVFDFTFAIRVLNQTASKANSLSIIREMVRVTKSGGHVLTEFVNARRPRIGTRRGVLLTFDEVGAALRDAGAEVVSERGIFVLSMTAVQRTPAPALDILCAAEGLLAKTFGRYASRCYTLARVPG